MAAKKTADLIPLCHPLPLSGVTVDLQVTEDAVLVNASARTTHMTGVEMEAMTAASVALLTVYDMVKSIDRGMTIEAVRLVSKPGGRSGRSEGRRVGKEGESTGRLGLTADY